MFVSYHRYSESLKRTVLRPAVAEFLKQKGIDGNDIGSHSIRKGASSFVSSGSTACPSHAALTLRAGWSLGDVQDRYLRYESAGDQYVGRTVCGLPCDSASFCILPPHFPERPPSLTNAIRVCFPNAPAMMAGILEHCLASIVYHRAFLTATLPANHKIFVNPVFTSPGLLDELSAAVVCRTPSANLVMRATGIPPHISLIADMTRVAERIETLGPRIDRVAPAVIEGVNNILEEKAVGLNVITREGMMNAIRDQFAPLMGEVCNAIDGLRRQHEDAPRRAPQAAPRNDAAMGVRRLVFSWGGRLHLLPENFAFPDAGVLAAWQYYTCGDASKNYPPLRTIEPCDMKDKNMKRRLADFKFLMNELEERVKAAGRWVVDPTLQQANDMFQASGFLNFIAAVTPHNRKRRVDQIKWTTFVNILRAKKNSDREQVNGGVVAQVGNAQEDDDIDDM